MKLPKFPNKSIWMVFNILRNISMNITWDLILEKVILSWSKPYYYTIKNKYFYEELLKTLKVLLTIKT